MQLSFLIQLLRYIAQGVLYLLIIAALSFGALTQTQRGRQALNHLLVNQFNDTFAGHLEIERIDGTIVGSLYAHNVQLKSPNGDTVLSAQAVELLPQWMDLANQQFSFKRVVLKEPDLYLSKTTDSTYNIAQAFKRVSPRWNPDMRWALSAAQIELHNGSLQTALRPKPSSADSAQPFFDVAYTHLDSLNLQATVEWKQDYKLIDVQNVSAYNPDLPLAIKHLHGQVVAENGRWSLNHAVLETAKSSVSLRGAFQQAAASSQAEKVLPFLQMRLTQATLSGAELSRIVPALSLQDSVTVEARLEGTPEELTINHLQLGRGSTHIKTRGQLRKTANTLRFSLQSKDNTLYPRDVTAVWPDSLLRQRIGHLDSLQFSLNSKGQVDLSNSSTSAKTSFPLHATTDLQLKGAVGQWTGQVELQATPQKPLAYNAHLTFQAGDLGKLSNHPALYSSLNGTATVQGTGLAWETVDARASLALAPSTVAGRPVDSLSVNVTAANRKINTQARLYQPNGFLYSEATVNQTYPVPAYQLYLSSRDLNVGPLISEDTVRTALNGTVRVNARGRSTSGWQGNAQVSVDSSQVQYPGRTHLISPSVSQITLRPRETNDSRFAIQGDVLNLDVKGDFSLSHLVQSGQLWAHTFAHTWRKVRNKPRMPYRLFSAGPLPDWYSTARQMVASNDSSAVRQVQEARRLIHLREKLQSSNLPSNLQASASLRLKQMKLLTVLFPASPRIEGNLTADAQLQTGSSGLSLKTKVQSRKVTGRRFEIHGVKAALDLQSAFDLNVAKTTNLQLDLNADYLKLPAQEFHRNHFSLAYDSGEARAEVQSEQIGTSSTFQSSFRVELLPSFNRLTIDQLKLSLKDSHWKNPGPQTLKLYQDAVVFDKVTVQNQLPGATADTTQSIVLNGALSSQPTDTARVKLQTVHLGEFSRIFALKNPIGGILNANIAFARSSGTLETTGSLHVRELTFDGHPLGELHAKSQYHPVYDALNLDLKIAHPTPLPNGIQNNVHLTGAVGLPQRTTSGSYLDPGFLNLSVNVNEADLFFFEDIFPGVVTNVRATASGSGAIRGDFSRPIFEGELYTSGRFHQPEFNLDYSLDGPIRVDAEGFHVDSVRVTDPTGGSAVIFGDVLFNEYQFFSFDLTGELDQLQAVNVDNSRKLPFYGHIWASGTAHLNGPLYDALLRAPNVVTTPNSELFIPVTEVVPESDEAFIVFADSTGHIPETHRQLRRKNILADRPPGERPFLEGLDMNLNIDAPRGSIVNLVFDPLLGDAVEAVGSGRIQLGINEGEFSTFGTFNITGGEYLFTASDMFSRRFQLEPGGTITWDGDPIDAKLDIPATYRTRASLAGLPGRNPSDRIPVVIWLDLAGRVTSPITDLRLTLDRDEYTNQAHLTSLEPILNDEERAAEFATSVLLTNSFRLTLTGDTEGITESVDQLAFSTVSQLVANQLNRFVNHALNNVDINLGVQQGTTVQDLDVTYGVALYLMDERLVIRGRGVYETTQNRSASENVQGKLTVEIRLSPTVSVEVFYRRENDLLESVSNVAPSYGAGVSYQTDFINWRRFLTKQWASWKGFWNQFVDLLLPNPASPPSTADTESDSTSTDTLEFEPIVRKLNYQPTYTASDSLSWD